VIGATNEENAALAARIGSSPACYPARKEVPAFARPVRKSGRCLLIADGIRYQPLQTLAFMIIIYAHIFQHVIVLRAFRIR
jgi:hypothetical protein